MSQHPTDPPARRSIQAQRVSHAAPTGFALGVISLSIALLGALFASGVSRVLTCGEGMLLLAGAFPVALVGIGFSLAGLALRANRAFAVVGLVLSALPVVALGIALFIVWYEFQRCAPSCF